MATAYMLTYEGRNSWIAQNLLQKRMWVDLDDFSALRACIDNDAVGVAKLLLDGGMDFEQYRQWVETYAGGGHEKTMQALADHWAELSAEMEQADAPEQDNAPEIGGMTFG